MVSEGFVTYFAVPLLILLARIVDVTIGTIKMVFINKGEKWLSAILGFFEVLVWLLAITRIMDNLSNVFAYVGFALGYAIGTYLGIVIEQKLLIGKVIVRVLTSKDAQELVKELRQKRYAFTCEGVDGPDGEVKSVHVIIHRKDLDKLISYILMYDNDAYYTVEDVKIVREHKFPLKNQKVEIAKTEEITEEITKGVEPAQNVALVPPQKTAAELKEIKKRKTLIRRKAAKAARLVRRS